MKETFLFGSCFSHQFESSGGGGGGGGGGASYSID
jgi:hypothetical protein